MLSWEKLLGFATASILILNLGACSTTETYQTNTSPTTEVNNPISEPSQASKEPLVNQKKELDCELAQTQAQINTCAGLQANKADEQLNQVYRQLRAKIKDSPQEQRLINAQLAWIKFRDADCDYAKGQYEGGSIVPTIYASCLSRLTEQRTKELADYLEEASL
ncbi:MAG: lysozyme inhibitor LprI family protein [Coleofasciculaceae cyanobacterium]